MAHIPVNHPLRPVYKTLGGLVGAYVLAFGILGMLETWGRPAFERDGAWVLGLRTNLAFAIISVLFGALIVLTTFMGGNLGYYLSLAIGVIFMVAGLVLMAVLQTDLNFLNFSMSTVIVSLIFGLVFLTAGLYGKVGTPEEAADVDESRSNPASSPRR